MQNKLLEILVCPLCGGRLVELKDKQQLICKFDRLAYPVVDGIPVLLKERTEQLSSEQVANIDD